MNLAITGGTGTLGHALVKLIHKDYDKIFIISRDELKQSQMEALLPYDNLRFILCDVRDYVRLSQVLEMADVVVHAAENTTLPSVSRPMWMAQVTLFGPVWRPGSRRLCLFLQIRL